MLLKRQFFLNKFILLLIISFVFSRGIIETSLLPSHITFANTKFDIVSNGNSHNRYIWLHGDEQTAKMALEHHIENYQGVAFFIDSKTREISFESI